MMDSGKATRDVGRPSSLRFYLLLGIVMLLWAGNSIVARAVRADIPPFTLALLRWSGATLIAMPFAWRHLVADRAVLLAAWRPLLVLGLCGIAAFNALLYSGLHHTTATNALLLQAAIPATVLLCNRLFFGAHAGWGQIVGVLLSTLGVLCVVLRGEPGGILSIAFNRGDVLVLCAVLCWAVYTSLLRLRPDCDPLSFLVVTFVIGVVVMAPLAMGEPPIRVNGRSLAAIAYVAVLPSLVAYQLYNAAVGALGAGRAGQTISLMPLFGSLLAAALLGEALHGYHAIGMVMILGGIVVAALSARPRGDAVSAT